jgi:hypothetical protein
MLFAKLRGINDPCEAVCEQRHKWQMPRVPRMPKVPRIKDVNHFIKKQRVMISGCCKADCTGFRPAAGLNLEP